MEIPGRTRPVDNPFVTHAQEYDRWFDTCGELFRLQQDFIRLFLLPGSGRILEIGCGSGRFSVALGILFGIDLSLPLCTMAYQRGVRVVLGDGEALPFQKYCFSQIFLITVLEVVTDPEKVLNEACMSLVPGGSLIVVFLDTGSEMGRRYERERVTSTFLSHARLFSRSDIRILLEKAGYRIVTFRSSAGLLLVSAKSRRINPENER
ncbi:MAG: class I SAM-dependent methyltransferase [Methanospirillum sp.]|nr:class I SAM-dependent methyltransferase [Methanospirillum sp.]